MADLHRSLKLAERNDLTSLPALPKTKADSSPTQFLWGKQSAFLYHAITSTCWLPELLCKWDDVGVYCQKWT